jgi:hypothetical protein
MMKTIDTLVDDIYGLFGGDVKFDPELFEKFGGNVRDLMDARFHTKRDGDPYLRMSNIGRPDRQLWYDMHPDGNKEEFIPSTLIKFAYGDLIEQMVILYAKMAGHTVEYEQGEVEVDGVKGHIDCKIDGVVVDVKSASSYSWQKFDSGALLEPGNDPFGYVAQLAGYVEALTPGAEGAFLAVDKTLGKLTLLRVPARTLADFYVRNRIEHIKEVVASDEVPDRCYEDVPDGKSGNRKLSTGCSYCAHKFRCWPDLKTYFYSNGPRYLTKVVKEPRVAEFGDYGG